jgi:hypothetical protein
MVAAFLPTALDPGVERFFLFLLAGGEGAAQVQ